MIKSILFPVDFSPACVCMAAYVKRVAALFNSRVTLVHVCDPTSNNGLELYVRTLNEVAEERWGVAKQKLDSLLECDFPACECKRVLRSGDPAEEIVEFARSGRFDLIVMPTHAGRFRQMLLGSTTTKVLDEAECMVMTTEHAETAVPEPLSHRHWVCGVGFGPDSERLLRLVARATEQAHAHLSLIHVHDPNAEKGNDGGFDTAERKQTLERLANQDIQVVEGHIKEALLEAVRHPMADVLIVGRSPKQGILGRMRDLTYSLIRDSPIPVLSV